MRFSFASARGSIYVLVLAAVLVPPACTKHDGLVLLDLRASGPLGAPVVRFHLSAIGWPDRTVTGTLGADGFRVGYYGPADGGPVKVTAQALDAVDCVLGVGSATVPALAEGATSDPITLFIRPTPETGCVPDAGMDAGGEDAGEDAGGDTGATDAGVDSPGDGGVDTGVDAAADGADDGGADGGTD